MTVLLLVMIWEISLFLAAASGFFVGKKYVGKRKKEALAPILTEEQKRIAEQEKRENEYFESYRGIPQWQDRNNNRS